MNEVVNGNKKLFWKEESKKKVDSRSRIKYGNIRFAQVKDEERKKYFEDLYNIDTQEQTAVSMCGFEGIQKDN